MWSDGYKLLLTFRHVVTSYIEKVQDSYDAVKLNNVVLVLYAVYPCTICIIIILLYYFSSPETQVRVMFDYTAQQPDELSIKVGEMLEVLSSEVEEVEEGWWKVCNDCAYLCMYI